MPSADGLTGASKDQRSGRTQEVWSIGTHEFIIEKADYAGQEFRVIVEIDRP